MRCSVCGDWCIQGSSYVKSRQAGHLAQDKQYAHVLTHTVTWFFDLVHVRVDVPMCMLVRG